MFTLTFSTSNAAFDPEPASEVARLLRQVAEKVEDGDKTGRVHDLNGNLVGAFTLGMD